jgi:hypothetical protein
LKHFYWAQQNLNKIGWRSAEKNRPFSNMLLQAKLQRFLRFQPFDFSSKPFDIYGSMLSWMSVVLQSREAAAFILSRCFRAQLHLSAAKKKRKKTGANVAIL